MKFRHLVSFTCDNVSEICAKTALRYDITVAVSFVSFKSKFENVV